MKDLFRKAKLKVKLKVIKTKIDYLLSLLNGDKIYTYFFNKKLKINLMFSI
jgi:hypothetical protein